MSPSVPVGESAATEVAEHLVIVAAVNEIGLAADLRDWPRVREQFARRCSSGSAAPSQRGVVHRARCR